MPTHTGTVSVTLTAKNGIGTNATQVFHSHPGEGTDHHQRSSTATFLVGKAGTSFHRDDCRPGFPTATTVTETGKLPTGVTFKSGKFSGTPAAGTGGSYSVTLTAGNGSASSTQAFILTVNQAPAITSSNKATFIVVSQTWHLYHHHH